MANRPRSQPRRRDTYSYYTKRPLNCLVFIAPLLLFFHIGAARYGTELLAPVVVRDFLGYLGAPAAYLSPLLIAGILLAQQAGRREKWKVQPIALIGMAAESLAYAGPLVALSYLTGQIASAAAETAPADRAILPQLLRAVGAGIYEEFLFRMVLLGLAMLLLVDVLELKQDLVAICAVVLGALAFSAVHFAFLGLGGQQAFRWSTFVFLTLAGIYWGILYLARGFGIAVGSHIVWDAFVLLSGS